MNNQKGLVLILILSSLTVSLCELRFVFTIFRNGANAVSNNIDNNGNDLFGESWTQPGELTPVGLRMHYLQGIRNRMRYSDFLSNTFQANEVYVRAADFNNTITAAQAVLQGLYPPSTGPDTTPYQRSVAYPPMNRNFGNLFVAESFGRAALPQNTQVFPVHTFNHNQEKYFIFEQTNCNRLESLHSENKNLEQVSTWLRNFTDNFGDKLIKILNVNDKDLLLNYDYTLDIMSTFVADYTEGKILKRFTDNGIDLRTFNETAYEFLTMDAYLVHNGYETDAFLPNATMSAFSDEIKMWMANRLNNDKNNLGYGGYAAPKMVLFSSNIVAPSGVMAYLSRKLGLKNKYFSYASELTFELRTKNGAVISSSIGDDSYNVDILFNGELLKTVIYREFNDLLNGTWNEGNVKYECSTDLLRYFGFGNSTIVLGVLLGVAVIGFIVLVVMLSKKNKEEENALPMQTEQKQ